MAYEASAGKAGNYGVTKAGYASAPARGYGAAMQSPQAAYPFVRASPTLDAMSPQDAYRRGLEDALYAIAGALEMLYGAALYGGDALNAPQDAYGLLTDPRASAASLAPASLTPAKSYAGKTSGVVKGPAKGSK